MPTPKSGYFKDGVRLPSTTTIIGRFKDAGALMYWASRLAYNPYCELRAWTSEVLQAGDLTDDLRARGLQITANPVDAADFNTRTEKAATIGSIVHARIDAHIRGKKFEPSKFLSRKCLNPIRASQVGFDAFLDDAQTKFKLGECEMQLVSKKYNYGGTPDVFIINKNNEVGDWKTGNLYPEQLLPQLAAYRNLLLENKHKVGEGAHAMSIHKESGGFTHRYFTPSEVDKGWDCFVKMNNLYQVLKQIGK